MLFGRKTPPAANPKPAEAPEAAVEAVPENAGAPAVPASPLSQPAPGLSAPASPSMPPPAGAIPSAAPLRPPFSDKGPEMNTTPPKTPAGPITNGSLNNDPLNNGPLNNGPTGPASSFKPSDIPRRTVDVPGMAARKPDGYAIPTPPAAPMAAPVPAPAPAPAVEQRRLIVGRDISLSGEIGSCDVLVVEGTVEAKLRDGRSIEIAENGLFKGSVEIDEADIGGRFEGDITVRGRLTVRSTGKITGSIKYSELAVEAGGQLVGDIQVFAAAAKPAPASTLAPAPEAVPSFAALDGE